MCFQKIHRLKNIQTCSGIQKKVTALFIEILQAKGHFYYLNAGYPLKRKFYYFNLFLTKNFAVIMFGVLLLKIISCKSFKLLIKGKKKIFLAKILIFILGSGKILVYWKILHPWSNLDSTSVQPRLNLGPTAIQPRFNLSPTTV